MASLVKIWITRYVDKEGRRVPKGTPGAKKVKERSTVWYGQYKEAGKWKREPLFTDKPASNVRLAELVKAEERGEAGLVNPHKEAMQRDIDGHVEDYLTHLRTEGANPKHLSERERLVRTVLPVATFKHPGRPFRRQDHRLHRHPAEEADAEQPEARPGLGPDEGHLPRRRPRLRPVVRRNPAAAAQGKPDAAPRPSRRAKRCMTGGPRRSRT